MAKERNPRVVVLEHVRAITHELQRQTSRWRLMSRKQVMEELPSTDGAAWPQWRPRRPDEYPENDPQEWELLARWLEFCSGGLWAQAEFARNQAARLVKERDGEA